MNNRQPFVLIDGSSYLYRAFHALPPLTNSHGEPTGAVYGVLNMIRKLLQDYSCEHIAVVFDPKGKTARDAIYPAYKSHRPPMPDELRSQIPPLFEAIEAMGLPLIVVDGVEADDVIATLTRQATEKNQPVLISTGDKDLAQLVNPLVTLINTMTGSILNPPAVLEKFGVPPERIVDYLALMGDSVDNIPGVPKVGPKTAAKWLQQYGSLSAIIAAADQFPGKVGENLRQSLNHLPLSKELVTLRLHESLPFSWEQLHKKPAQHAKLLTLFQRLEFKNWLKELLTHKDATPADVTRQYDIILTAEDFDRWLLLLKNAEQFAMHLETTHANPWNAQIIGIAVAIAHRAAYIPLAHHYLGVPQQLSGIEVLSQFKPLWMDTKKKIICQNAKYLISLLAYQGIPLTSHYYDTMLESYVLDPTNRHDVENLALKYLGRRMTDRVDLVGKGVKQLGFQQIDVQRAGPYAAEIADFILQIHEVLWQKISTSGQLVTVLQQIELPLAAVLSRMELYGVMINKDLLAAQSTELDQRLHLLQEKAYQLAGCAFNLSSPKQLQAILYEKLKLPVLDKTPTGVPSTAEAVLQELALNYPLPKVILEYRSLSKLKSTYTDSLPKQIDPHTGRVHTSYNQAVTSTGRLSSTDPNLQNIPIRTEEGRRIRQAFIAPPGFKIISADYSQVELRIMAHLSQDSGLLQAFAHDLDIHAATAAEIFGSPITQVSSEQRRHAKAINFGLIYGMSAFGLGQQLGISRELAQVYMDKYFARYPSVKTYMQTIRDLAYHQGFVETLMGRRLYVPEIRSSQMLRRRAAERAAINAPMQGTAADIIKIAMIRIDEWIRRTQLPIKMVMQVHDELVFEVAEDILPNVIPKIRECMTTALSLDVPLIVQIQVGRNWDEAH